MRGLSLDAMRRLGLIRYDADQAAFYREKLVERVQTDVRDCYQCGNCSAGCPAAFTFDYTPNQVMRMLQVGLVDKVLDSKAVQLCVQCLTCTAGARATSTSPASSKTSRPSPPPRSARCPST